MKLPTLYKDRRLDGETPLRQCQLVEVHLLAVFKKLCDAHNIKFWLCAGTLLGAMRHQGFIPWDDDLDVFILKKDYEKFIRFAKDELPDDVYLDLPTTKEACRQENNLTRLRDNYSTGLIRHNKRLQINDHHGINIDIFVLEEGCAKTRIREWLLHSFVSNRGWYRRAHYDEVTLWSLIRKWSIGIWVGAVGCLWRMSGFLATDRNFLLQTNFYTAWRWWIPRDWFIREGECPRMVMFEGEEMPVPYEAEKLLEMQFGNWKELPPVENRKGYLGIILPTTPCMHPAAMKYPTKE